MSTSIAALLEDALREIAGPGAEPTSMTVDYGPTVEPAAAKARAKAWIERSTRSLVFAQAEVRTTDGALVAAASAVFRRVIPT
jgi:acyl-coenzyme A thioesterase PaaI-like protein